MTAANSFGLLGSTSEVDAQPAVYLLPARFDRWMSSFLKRHGATATNVVDGVLIGVAQDGTEFEAQLPFGRPYDGPERTDDFLAAAYPPREWGLLLVRKGGYAVAHVQRERILSSKVGQRFVPGAHRVAQRWSRRWFEARWLERRREALAERAIQAASEHAVQLIGRCEDLVVGGDPDEVAEVLRRANLAGTVVATLPDIREPRRGVYEEAVIDARSVKMTVFSAAALREARFADASGAEA